MEKAQYHAIGKRIHRKDGVAKVTGQEIYTCDILLPRMLHARVLRSPLPHARVKSIDTIAAERMGAVCLTFKDIPKVKYTERVLNIPRSTYKDRYVLADKPRHVGEAVAAVAAETEEMAEKALSLIKVDYEKEAALFDAAIARFDLVVEVFLDLAGRALRRRGEPIELALIGVPAFTLE